MNFLNKLFQMKPGEGKKVLPFFLCFFFVIGSFMFGRTARDTFFLSRFDPAYLPHMMIITAVMIGITIAIMTKLSAKIPVVPQIIGTFGIGATSFIVIQLLLAEWIYPVLYIWFEVIGTVMMIQFWMLTGSAFTAREAKRLFSLIASGAAIANTILGFSMGSLVDAFGTNFLLPSTSVFIGFAIVAAIFGGRFIETESSAPSKSAKPKKETKTKGGMLASPYLKVMTLTIAFAAVVGALVDYQMKIIVSDNLDESEMAALFGTLYGAIGFVSIFMQFFVTGRFLSKFGVLWGLMFLPAVLLLGNGMVFLAPVVISGVLAKAGDQIFRFTLHDTSSQLLWLPVSPQEKSKAKPFIDGTVKNGAAGIAGLLIIGLSFFVDDIRLLSIPSVVMLAVWLVANFKLKTGYVAELRKAIEKRRLDFEELEIDVTDPVIVETIRKTLTEGDDHQKLFALDTMKNLPLAPWKSDILELFESGSPVLKGKILVMTSKHPDIIPDEVITPLIDHEDESLAARAMISCGIRRNTSTAGQLVELLSKSSRERKAAAAASLILMEDSSSTQANETINQMLFDEDKSTQLAALSSVGHISGILSDEGLAKLLNDDSPDVRSRAAQLAEERSDESLISPLVRNLDDPHTLPAARRALKFFDESTVAEKLGDVLNDEETSATLLIGAVRTLSDYRDHADLEKIIEQGSSDKLDLTKEVVDSLLKLARQSPLPEEIIHKSDALLKEMAEETYSALTLFQMFEDDEKGYLIRDFLSTTVTKRKGLILKLALLPFPDSPIETYMHALTAGESGAQSNVLEILDNLLSIEIREFIIPLFDDSDLSEKVDRGNQFVSKQADATEAVANWLYSGNPWTSAIALDYSLNSNTNNEELDWTKIPRDQTIREVCSAQWAKDSSPLKTMKDFPTEEFILKEASMYSTLEKTIFMKGVDLFRDISGEEVSHVAQIAEEIEYGSEQTIFDEGDVGDSMFIIIDGAVKIHKGDKELAVLSKGKFVGEMALLDQEPRSASVTSTEETTLLEINGEDFYDLMASRMEIMQGIVKILTQRLREANA
ncbi:MAG: Npt1/Npt2 family nucleotide transporter [Candidatus Marinimicrobia bacterium]|nr:Npt1/Npt2 family nucleotide transporter [Candidatus Neomarinimicrobiota bacterium]